MKTIKNKNTGTSEIYEEAFYTKIDSIYGYIFVDGSKVKFVYDDNGSIQMDELTEYEIIESETK